LGQKSRSKRPLFGSPAVRSGSNRKVFDFRQTKFWAERGLIHTVNEETGGYTVVSVREWLLRARALSKQAWREKYADERGQMVVLIENMVKAAQQAKRQGDPHTRDGLAEAKRRMPLRVSLPEVSYNYKGEVRSGAAASKLILPGDPGYR
jgi:hypothetical protein